MLSIALDFIREELNQHLRRVEALNLSPLDEMCVLGDIARVEDGTDPNISLNEKVLISLLKIEEEYTLSNRRHYVDTSEGVQYQHPPLFLNVYVLFSSTFANYNTSLVYLDEVLQFFQSNRVFTNASHPSLDSNIDKLLVEFFDPGFEHLNHIWGMLGGKAYPSTTYRFRLVAIRARPSQVGEVIDAVGLNENSF